ncbi:TrmH family RNA methyltransferase [Patescibacteria group bacterium]|nr:MAG: TrmH family RNA methyltransferase [Patescibacteria group bacterium]
MRDIVIIAHDIRSSHNVGSLLRTAEGIGVSRVWLTGYTPYPAHDTDTRLPHLAQKTHRAISKTALGAEDTQAWARSENISEVLDVLRQEGYTIVALEQADASVSLPTWQPPDKIAIVLGREVEGVEPDLLHLCDVTLEIPMSGQKESYNVVQAAAMALYHCRFMA